MSTPLLSTKFYIPPIRPELVPRPRLIECLNEGMTRKVTLVSAPAGYGKTTLLSEWVHQGGNGSTLTAPVAWISLDEADHDPTHFLSYLIGATQTIVPNAGAGLLQALQSEQAPPVQTVLISLINELTAVPCDGGRCCLLGLVLDDYHRIENPEIHDAVAFLVEHLPPPPEGVHLIIASRKDPLLPLPRWRAAGQMTEVREADLRFSPQEAKAFLNEAMGLTLSGDDVTTLAARTEGWITGLQLAALSMRDLDSAGGKEFISAFAGDDRHIVDYLLDEVLAHRPQGTQEFLLKTSILERMTGPLCDAVTGQRGGQAVLKVLEQSNLFVVPLDSRRQWYRYHHMFADLLLQRLKVTVGAETLATLHGRASDWYDQNGYAAEAVYHAFGAGDLLRAAELIEQSAREMIARSELRTLMSWVDPLPRDLVQTRPWLCVFYAWALRLTGGGAEAVESRLHDTELALESAKTSLPADEARTVRGHVAAIRAYQALYKEDIPRALDLARQALDRLPEATYARGLTALALGWAARFSGDLTGASEAFAEARAASLAAGNTYVAVAATSRLAYTEVLAGQLKHAERTCRAAIRMAEGEGGVSLPVAGYALVYLGNLYREWDLPEEATRHLEQGIALCKQVGFLMDQIVGYTALARVFRGSGDWKGAHNALQIAERTSQMMRGYLYARRWVEDCQIRLWAAQNMMPELTRWIEETSLQVDDELTFARELEHVVLARALVAVGRRQRPEAFLASALDLLGRLLDLAQSRGWIGKAIEILVLESLAHEGCGETDLALAALERALAHAEPHGYMRVFVDEGDAMAHLLREVSSRQPATSQKYLNALLAAYPKLTSDEGPEAKVDDLSAVRRPAPTEPGTFSALVEPLSERELQVLRLIAEGLTNREIAQSLYLAVSTVKVHTRNIYGKLGVHSRTQAVARARQTGIL